MPDPFSIKTPDSRFDPREPVTVNGFLYIPAAAHDRRVSELLEANNRYLERARAAEREGSALLDQIAEMEADRGFKRQDYIDALADCAFWKRRAEVRGVLIERARAALKANGDEEGGAHEVAKHPKLAGQGSGVGRPDGDVPTSGPEQGGLEQ